ncbi:MAG: glycolate oxidase subunit GlcF [Betaproteobacteria bacterium]|nr:glycolate oxidase subunit GlcF [Betaproteobacteria bacterium]
MQTNLAQFIKDTPEGQEADAILRKCVHCGFCNATCPTYQLLGDELDGPRGRIYLIKQVLEGASPSEKTQIHLDRCLTCRACETTCPSGVQYARLADIGRAVVEARVERPLAERLRRSALRRTLAEPRLFAPLLALGQLVSPWLPSTLRARVPPRETRSPWAPLRHARRMLVLDGCVQPALAPNINAAASRVLDRLGISLQRVAEAGCCGAIDFHLNAADTARQRIRNLIDAWWPHLEGAEAIVFTASGCGVMLRDYAHVLVDDPRYRDKARRIAESCRDLSEVLLAEREKLRAACEPAAARRVAFHSPCTLQHGLRVRGAIETLLSDLGFELAAVPDAHLCCGSAGTYSILQPELSQRLKDAKQAALNSGQPDEILTANIGCLMHLRAGMQTPLRHWIEAVAERISTGT